ncbi:DUF5632 domain-containing protein [Mycobacterium sp. Marseille-P9652]|uniref:DUF5632 domain-containing protein n=1 Tax=Mycobacterium sp. Marseille-P9652 TaxID=2654950 RepID=UPI0012E88B4D|nr:DUF5632 domain-containing protein [Mycobacterium sp. Marseille-P9652]
MAIFGRITARQRLRRATRESLAIPAFSSPIDCTPWVTGGLWPAELSTTDPETAGLAEHLRTDLERIARSANDELKLVKRSGLPDPARQAEEARIIDDARARAERRVESTVRQLHTVPAPAHRRARHVPGTDFEATQVLPAVTEWEPVPAPAQATPEPRWRVAAPRHDETLVIPAVTDDMPAPPVPPLPAPPEPPEAVEPEPVIEAPVAAPPPPASAPDEAAPAHAVPARGEPDGDRLNRLLEFVVRQEPRLNWAVGDHVDGTTVVVTDLAHGWIPPGISLPAGVRLLDPARRDGKAAALIGETARVVTYAPGDSLRRSADLATTTSSLQPRELPATDDLGGALSAATRRDGLPRMVHAMASTAAAGTRIADQEVDVLRVHLDTARYQLLVQHPNVDPTLLLNCLLLAATEAFVIGDTVSANYHLRWFQALEAAPPS